MTKENFRKQGFKLLKIAGKENDYDFEGDTWEFELTSDKVYVLDWLFKFNNSGYWEAGLDFGGDKQYMLFSLRKIFHVMLFCTAFSILAKLRARRRNGD